MTSLIGATFPVLLLSYVVLAIVCSLAAPVGKFDDAIPLVHGMLVQEGYTPNIDFYSFYPPLNVYLNAGLFSVFGRSVVPTRLAGGVLYAVVLILTAWFFRSRSEFPRLLVAPAVLLVAASVGGAINLPFWPGFALSLAALMVYLSSQTLHRFRLWVVAFSGILAALALLFRINFGGYVVFVVAADLFIQLSSRDKTGRGSFPTSEIAAFVLPFALSCAGLCFWVYGRRFDVGVSEFIVTAQKLMAIRGFISLELTAAVACAVILPPAWFLFRLLQQEDGFSNRLWGPVGFCAVLLITVLAGRAHYSTALILVALEIGSVLFLHIFVFRLRRSELCVLLFFCCLLHYFLSRADWSHWRILPVGGALLLPLFFLSRHRTGKPPVSIRNESAIAFLAAAVFLLTAAPEFRPAVSQFRNGLNLLTTILKDPHTADADRVMDPEASPAWAALYPDKDELEALHYIRERSSSSAPIFVGVQDHSMVFWNDLRMYWLANRPIGVRTFQLETRMATEPAVQRQIIEDLHRNNVIWLVLDSIREGDTAFKLDAYKGSSDLDNYIGNFYKEEARFGPYVILTKIA